MRLDDHIQRRGDYVVITDTAGRGRVTIGMGPQGPVVGLYHPDGCPAAGVSFREEDGRLVVLLTDDLGFSQAGVILGDDKRPLVIEVDAAGNPIGAHRVLESSTN